MARLYSLYVETGEAAREFPGIVEMVRGRSLPIPTIPAKSWGGSDVSNWYSVLDCGYAVAARQLYSESILSKVEQTPLTNKLPVHLVI